MNKPKIAVVRGKFLNKFEMQSYEHLVKEFDITAFGSHSSFHNKFDFPVKNLFSPIDIPDFPFKMPLINRLLVDAHYLLGLEKKLKGFDIAHSAETYYHYTQQCLIAKKKGYVKKVVVTVLENIPHANEGIWGRVGYKKRAYKEVDLFLASTQDAKNALIEEGVDGKKVKVVYSGVDTQRFCPSKKKSKEINILFVGRLEKYKGVNNLVKAFTGVQKKQKGIHLTIVGSGSEEKNLKHIAKEGRIEDVVTFKKVPYDKIHSEYQNADIFIAPSIDTPTWREQFGYTLIEAIASGLPVITTDAGSIPEVIGDSVIIVPQDDVKKLTQELKKLIDSKKGREELGKKARLHTLRYYDSRKVAKNIAEIYKSII